MTGPAICDACQRCVKQRCTQFNVPISSFPDSMNRCGYNWPRKLGKHRKKDDGSQELLF